MTAYKIKMPKRLVVATIVSGLLIAGGGVLEIMIPSLPGSEIASVGVLALIVIFLAYL